MILGKYNQAKTITFDLVAPDGVDLIINATFATGDLKIMKDEAIEVDTTNLPTDEGTGYSLVLTATEMSAARIRVYVIDQTGTKVWLDVSLGVETYGNASAEHAFDLDTASTAQTADNNTILAALEVVSFTVGTASLTTSTFSTNLTLVTDQYGSSSDNQMYIRWDANTDTTALQGQTSKIIGCVVTNGVITVESAFTAIPAASTDTGIIF